MEAAKIAVVVEWGNRTVPAELKLVASGSVLA
jgi:hypothetical protein